MTEQRAEAKKKEEKASLKEMKSELENEKQQGSEKTKGLKMTIITNTRKFKDRVNKEIVDRSKKVEKMHKKIASWPYDRLAKVNRLERTADDLNAIQTKIIKHSYDLIRTVVSNTDDVFDEILKRAEKRFEAA